MPKIIKIDNNTFEVTITAAIETTHRVTVDDDYHKKLTKGYVEKEQLVEEAFKFLLNRESNSSILSEFTLKTIEQYFPEFPGEMRNRFI